MIHILLEIQPKPQWCMCIVYVCVCVSLCAWERILYRAFQPHLAGVQALHDDLSFLRLKRLLLSGIALHFESPPSRELTRQELPPLCQDGRLHLPPAPRRPRRTRRTRRTRGCRNSAGPAKGQGRRLWLGGRQLLARAVGARPAGACALRGERDDRRKGGWQDGVVVVVGVGVFIFYIEPAFWVVGPVLAHAGYFAKDSRD